VSQTAAECLVLALSFYFGLGAAFALLLIGFALPRLDHDAAKAPWGFRLLLIPGAALFWPLLLSRLIRKKGQPPQERNAHLDALARLERGKP
jgi:hypothetical protein